jgi:hypothetical protein
MSALKTCSRCREAKPLSDFGPNRTRHDGVQAYCRGCARAVCQEHRRAHPEMALANTRRNAPHRDGKRANHLYAHRAPHAISAHQAVCKALKSGKLVRPARCSRCPNTERLHAHHDDYTRKLDVTWLCTRCHHARHAELEALGLDPHAAFRRAS